MTWKTIKTLEEIFKTNLNYLKSQGVINYQSEKYAIYNQKGELIREKRECPAFHDYPIIYFGYIPWGYAWSFPGTENQILGICGLNRKVKGRFKECFYNFLKKQPVSENKDLNLKGYPPALWQLSEKPGHNNILLIGDACGLADPLLGENIYYAHKSGQLSAMAVLESYNNPGNALKIYKKLLHGSLIIDLKYAKIRRQIVFSIFSIFNYKPLPIFMRMNQRAFEEIVHGQRSFKWWKL